MGILVRMIEKQKWEKVNLMELGYNKTPADTITSDLKTSSNTLSLWLIDSINDLVKGVLALAVVRNKITRLDVMIFEEHELVQNGLLFKCTPENGHCPVEEFNRNHFDIINMDYEKLGKLSDLIIANLSNEKKCLRFDKAQISNILYDGFINQVFSSGELNESLENELKKIIIKKQNLPK